MSDELDVDPYDVSDTSSGGVSNDEEDIGDIVENIDLVAIAEQVLGQKQEPSFPTFFMTGPQYQIFNKYLPQWMNPSEAFRETGFPLRHPALRPDDVWQVQDEWFFPTEYAR